VSKNAQKKLSFDSGAGPENDPAPSFVSPPEPAHEAAQILTLDEDRFRAHLKAIAKQFGFIVDAAAVWGVSPQFLGDVLAGRKNPGPKLLGSLGVRARTVYDIELIREEETKIRVGFSILRKPPSWKPSLRKWK